MAAFFLFIIIEITVGTLWIVKIMGLAAIGTLLLRNVLMRIAGQLPFCQFWSEEFYIAAIGAGIDLQFQSACQQMRKIPKEQSGFTKLNFLSAKTIHITVAAKTLQLLHQAFSTAAITATIASVSTVSIRPLS